MSAAVPEHVPVATYRQYVAGQWIDASDGRTFDDVNPYDGTLVARIPAGTGVDAGRAVQAAADAFPSWAAAPPEQKQRLFLRTADVVEARAADITSRWRSGTRLRAKAETISVGDPRRDGTIIGPLITVPADATIGHDETFGPVLVVEPVDDAAHAVRVANDHGYGLSAGILTTDLDTALKPAGQIESGMVRINDQTVHDEPQMPLGGVRDSGWGRAGPHSIEDFTQLQWVSVQSGTRPFPL